MSTSDSTTSFTIRNQTVLIDTVDADLSTSRWFIQCGYAYRGKKNLDGTWGTISMHRIVLGRKIGHDLADGEFVDHVNGNRLDNRRENLRLATRLDNARNAGRYKNNISGYKGVGWSNQRNKWRARIRVNGKLLTLGFFEKPEDAYICYCEAARKYFGEFARIDEVDK